MYSSPGHQLLTQSKFPSGAPPGAESVARTQAEDLLVDADNYLAVLLGLLFVSRLRTPPLQVLVNNSRADTGSESLPKWSL